MRSRWPDGCDDFGGWRRAPGIALSRIAMRALNAFRDRRSRPGLLARWWALAAAISFALIPVLHAPAMAAAAASAEAPPGFAVICSSDGVKLIPADPALPVPEDSEAGRTVACLDCCAPPAASLPPHAAPLVVPVPWLMAAADPAPRAPPSRPAYRPLTRAPPAA